MHEQLVRFFAMAVKANQKRMATAALQLLAGHRLLVESAGQASFFVDSNKNTFRGAIAALIFRGTKKLRELMLEPGE